MDHTWQGGGGLPCTMSEFVLPSGSISSSHSLSGPIRRCTKTEHKDGPGYHIVRQGALAHSRILLPISTWSAGRKDQVPIRLRRVDGFEAAYRNVRPVCGSSSARLNGRCQRMRCTSFHDIGPSSCLSLVRCRLALYTIKLAARFMIARWTFLVFSTV